jgi:hypothetical protein
MKEKRRKRSNCFRGAFPSPNSKKGAESALVQRTDFTVPFGAGEANRTPDPNLGNVHPSGENWPDFWDSG